MEALDRLFRPRSIAVVGASADPKKLTGRPVAYLQKHGFTGAILPVNPRYPRVAGLPCYPGIDSLPTVPDVGLVLLGGDQVLEAVRAYRSAGRTVSSQLDTDARKLATMTVSATARLRLATTPATATVADCRMRRARSSASRPMGERRIPAGARCTSNATAAGTQAMPPISSAATDR